MSEHTPRMNRLLIFVAVFLCLICGILFTQSSAGPFESSSTSVVSINTSDISTIEPSSDRDHHTNASISSGAPSPSATPSPVPTEIPETEKVSPEAENGVWTPDGTNWKFMVDGTAYTGWLTDTDGHRYYFNKDGIMQTGWQNVNGNWYYLNSKGAMQTGWLLKEGKYYFLNTDGTMAYGWVNSQGSWYYFQKPDGDMLTNAYAPDGRYVNAEGVLIQ